MAVIDLPNGRGALNRSDYFVIYLLYLHVLLTAHIFFVDASVSIEGVKTD